MTKPRQSKRDRLSQSDREKLMRRLDAGESQSKIAGDMGISQAAVSYYARGIRKFKSGPEAEIRREIARLENRRKRLQDELDETNRELQKATYVLKVLRNEVQPPFKVQNEI